MPVPPLAVDLTAGSIPLVLIWSATVSQRDVRPLTLGSFRDQSCCLTSMNPADVKSASKASASVIRSRRMISKLVAST